METSELQELLAAKKKKKTVDIFTPKAVPITENALKKAQAFGPELERISNVPYEWYGYLLGNMDDKEHVVRDMILAADQLVSTAHVNVDGENVARAGAQVIRMNEELGTNYHIVGWTHNHGGFTTFHSEHMDVPNHKIVLNLAHHNTISSVLQSFPLIESSSKQDLLEDRIIVKGIEDYDGAIEFVLENEKAIAELLKKNNIKVGKKNPKKVALDLFNDLLSVSETDVKEPKTMGFVYSIVVNNLGSEPYAEIAAIEKDVFTEKEKTYTAKVGIDRRKVDDDIKFTIKDLEAEIRANINIPVPVQAKRHKRKKKRGFWKSLLGIGDEYDNYSAPAHKDPKYSTPPISYDHVTGTTRPVQTQPDKIIKVEVPTQPASVAKTEKIEITGANKIPLKELTRRFAADSFEYIWEASGHYSKYKQFMDEVFAVSLLEDGSFVDSVQKIGYPVKDINEDTEKLVDSVIEMFSDRAYNNVEGDKKNQKAIDFMLDFVNSNYADRDSVIEDHMINLVGINPIVEKFAEKFLSYSDSPYYSKYKYIRWANHVLFDFNKSKEVTLEDAIAISGEVTDNNQTTYSHFSRSIFPEIKVKIITGHYDKTTLRLMEEFNKEETKEKTSDDALEKIAKYFIKKLAKEEQKEVEQLLKENKEKPPQKNPAKRESSESESSSEVPEVEFPKPKTEDNLEQVIDGVIDAQIGEGEQTPKPKDLNNAQEQIIIEHFSNALKDYLINRSVGEGKWISDVLFNLASYETANLDSAMLQTGVATIPNKDGRGHNYIRKGFLLKYEETAIEKIKAGTYTSKTIEFMKEFSDMPMAALDRYYDYLVAQESDVQVTDLLTEHAKHAKTATRAENKDDVEIGVSEIVENLMGDIVQELDLDPIVKEFARKAYNYATRSNTPNQLWVNEVLTHLIQTEGATLESSIATIGELKDIEITTMLKKADKGVLEARLYAGTYDANALKFMKSFNNSRGRDAALESYSNLVIEKTQKEKEVINEFAKNAVAFAEMPINNATAEPYQSWFNSVIDLIMANKGSESFTFKEAVTKAGEILKYKGYNLQGLSSVKAEMLEVLITTQEYGKETLEFMETFNNPATRYNALDKYSDYVLRKQGDQKEVEELLKENRQVADVEDSKLNSAELQNELPLSVNPIVAKFVEEAMVYATSNRNAPYSGWLNNIFNWMNTVDNNLQAAILEYKGPIADLRITFIPGDTSIKSWVRKIVTGDYDAETLEFMGEFNNPKTRNEAIEKYVKRVFDKYEQQD